MNPRLFKTLMLSLAALLLVGTGFIQKSLNHDRATLGLTRVEPLENAPPVLAFTTVALGGFRGLISNALWIRANELQENDKFFEMAQLADWITKLEPHFVQVWLVQAWNMAYNISVKFKDYPDRWRWVQRGIELLRDEGLRYNPNELLLYRELAWFFQHKMGQNLDDASLHYKREWAKEMEAVFPGGSTLDQLINPSTPEEQKRADLLRTKYKMDPVVMKEVDQEYGPLEWRLPESHAIYWASMGFKAARDNPEKVKKDDFIVLHRVIYQSMQMSFHRGRIVNLPFSDRFEFGPNLDIVANVTKAYEQAAEDNVNNRDHILRASRNFLRDAVYFLYVNNREAEAEKWFKYLGQQFPDKQLLDNQPETLPGRITLSEYAVARVQEDIGETDRNRIQSAVEGLLTSSYMGLILGDEGRYEGLQRLARQVYETYQSKVPPERHEAIGLRPLEEIANAMLTRLLDPNEGLPPEIRAELRTRLDLPAEIATPEKPQQAQRAPGP
jgi:hypothetical protein